MKLTKVIIIISVSIIAGLSSLASITTEDEDVIKVGDQIPLLTLNGEHDQISNIDLKEKTVLINFFATWCPPCVKELPVLQKEVWEQYKSNDNFVLLVIGREHSIEDLKLFAEKKGLDLPFYPDPEREVFSKFARQSIPRNYIINKKGEVIYSSVGYNHKDFEELKSVLKDELK